MSEETVDYIIKSVSLIAKEGYRMLPWYKYESETITWAYIGTYSNTDNHLPLQLWDLRAAYTKLETHRHEKVLNVYYNQAYKLLMSTDPCMGPSQVITQLPKQARLLRWFVLPEEMKVHRIPNHPKMSKGNSLPKVSFFGPPKSQSRLDGQPAQ
jgi:hypothetical protein